MARYKCKECGVEAEIDKESKSTIIYYRPETVKLDAARRGPVAFRFPIHSDCELAKPLHEIDIEKLERVE